MSTWRDNPNIWADGSTAAEYAGLEDEWQLAEHRMPDGWTIRSLIRISDGWEVVGDSPDHRNIRRGQGETPIAAIRDLWVRSA